MVQLQQQKTTNTKTRLEVGTSVHFTQINLQHNKSATAQICKQITNLMSSVVLIQEPWVNKNKILGLRSKVSTLFCGCNKNIPKTCVITKGIHSYCLPQFGSKDQTAVCINFKNSNKEYTIVVASIYMPTDSILLAPETERLIQYCNHNKLPLIIRCDANAHHFRWGSQECNRRGYTLSEYLATTDLEVVNQGSEPTFCVNNKRTVIDVTLATKAILAVIQDWQVMPGDSFSDHRQIKFVIKQDKRPPNRRRNIKNTNWNTYEEELSAKVGLWFGNITTPADIERELTSD